MTAPRQRYLLDTNVVSALRSPRRHPRVAQWAAQQQIADLFICAFTVAEIERGIVAKERSDRDQGMILRTWFESSVLPSFADRILPFDEAAVRIFAGYRIPEHAPMDDALIAAVAEAGSLTVVTRNTRHFSPLGVAVLDPWA